MLHEDRGRAESFGTAAERYDRARPSYPAAMVDDLLAGLPAAAAVLDVGCGTGIASRLFVARGCAVLGVEQDDRMAAVARTHGLAVEVAPFEAWEPAGRRFDLVVSGQAWHWMDPAVAPAKAAAVLRPGGRLAAFWNHYRHDPDVFAELRQAHAVAGAGDVDSIAIGGTFTEETTAGRRAADLAAIDACAAFEPVDVWRYTWDRVYERDQWIADLSTHSGYATLPADTRARVLAAIGAVVEARGGRLTVRMTTEVLTTVRRRG